MHEITIAKNNDYTGDSDDPFANFRQSEYNAGVTVEQGFLVRMGDKMSRIKALLSVDQKVKDESIQDTLLDLANYSLLLIGLLEDKKNV